VLPVPASSMHEERPQVCCAVHPPPDLLLLAAIGLSAGPGHWQLVGFKPLSLPGPAPFRLQRASCPHSLYPPPAPACPFACLQRASRPNSLYEGLFDTSHGEGAEGALTANL